MWSVGRLAKKTCNEAFGSSGGFASEKKASIELVWNGTWKLQDRNALLCDRCMLRGHVSVRTTTTYRMRDIMTSF